VDKDKDNNTQPVQIGWVDNEIEDAEAIINLSDGMPDTSNHLKKIHEIIENIDEKKEKARERWKKYKSIGFNIKAYKVI
jgi:DNA polymerase IIIc chi subunit